MKKSTFSLLLICAASLMMFAQPVFSQKSTMKRMVFDAGEVTIIHGLGAIIKSDNKSLVVEMAPPKEHLSKEYKDVDLLKGDVIKMCNGKSVKSIDDLNGIIEELEVGAEISFGIKRGKNMMIVSFPKADPKAGGQMMMMTQTIDDDGGDVNTTMMMNGESMDNVIFLDVGLIINEIETGISVAAIMPMLGENIEGKLPQQGDIIISLNGEKETSAEKLESVYSKIAEGENVKMSFSRDGKEFTITFVKKAMTDGEVIIKKQ